MKIRGKEVKYHWIISGTATALIGISILLKLYSNHNYWRLTVPPIVQPYVERGIVKEVYTLSPTPNKVKVKQLSIVTFGIGWFILLIQGFVFITLLEDNDSITGSNRDNKKDTKVSNDPLQRQLLELKTFILSHSITLVICNNSTPINLSPLINTYMKVIKDLGFHTSYGEINKLEGLNATNCTYICQPSDRIRERVHSICTEVATFRQEREQRFKRGSKLCLIINNLNKLLILSRQESLKSELINDLEIISILGLKDTDMRLLLIYDNNETESDIHIGELGGIDVGIIEFKNTSKTHITLKTQGKDDKTIVAPNKESLKHLV